MKQLQKDLAALLAVILLLSGCQKPDNSTSSAATQTQTTAEQVTTTEPATTQPESTEPEMTQYYDGEIGLGGYAVSSSTSEATAAGLQILRQGGNAVDAAVAVAFALGVTEPYSSGLGGGGVMVVYDPTADAAYSLDYYARAGSALENTDFVGVPGYLAGMQEALDLWGTCTLEETLAPAIQLAEKGFPATALFARRLTYSDKLRENPAFADVKEGDTVVQKELAKTLKQIRDEGTEIFYHGQIASDIAAACDLTEVDLASYQIYCTDALKSKFNGYRIYTTDAPTSGVVTSQMLTVADLLDVPNPHEDPVGYLEVMKLATSIGYKTRRNKLVDPRFYAFNGKNLVSRKYIKKLIAKAQEETETLAVEPDPERRCTTQFAVIDKDGMVVCVTNTLSDNWGGYLYVDGFYLNNTLSNFNTTGKNAYEPLKRPRTHFSPVIAVGKDHACLAIGSPGGDNIPKVVAQVLIEVLKEGTDLQTAVDQGRYYFDDDGVLCLETALETDSLIDKEQIEQNFYFSSSHVVFGCTAIVGYDPATGIVAVSDQRRDGSDAKVVKLR